MNVRWLGQAGLLFCADGRKILIDPYFSDSVAKINPKNYRRIPVDETWFSLDPDVLIFTHDHLDHYDPQTVEQLLASDKEILVLAPSSVWQKVRSFGGNHNYVQFNAGTEWTEGGIHFRSIFANHSDPFAIGVVLEAEGKRCFVTGDTLYDSRILREVGAAVNAVFLPVNGVGNNMNMVDAARFAKALRAGQVIPLHYGMFDELDISRFRCDNKVLLRVNEELTIL